MGSVFPANHAEASLKGTLIRYFAKSRYKASIAERQGLISSVKAVFQSKCQNKESMFPKPQ